MKCVWSNLKWSQLKRRLIFQPIHLLHVPPLFDIDGEMKDTQSFKAIREQKKGEKNPVRYIFFGSKVFNFTSSPHLDQSLPTAAIIRGQSLCVFALALVVITTVKVCSLPTFHLLSCQELMRLPRTERWQLKVQCVKVLRKSDGQL